MFRIESGRLAARVSCFALSRPPSRRETDNGLFELTRTAQRSVRTGSGTAFELVQWLLSVRTPPTWMLSKAERTDLELELSTVTRGRADTSLIS